jgi:hypothetical protein
MISTNQILPIYVKGSFLDRKSTITKSSAIMHRERWTTPNLQLKPLHTLWAALTLSHSLTVCLSLSHTHIYIYTFCELLRSKDMHGKKTTFCPEVFSKHILNASFPVITDIIILSIWFYCYYSLVLKLVPLLLSVIFLLTCAEAFYGIWRMKKIRTKFWRVIPNGFSLIST